MTMLLSQPAWRWTSVFHAAALFSMPVPVAGGDPDVEPGKSAVPNHVFWRVEKPGGDALFFLGSLHFGDGRLYPLPRVVETAYESCDRLILETNLDGSANGTVSALMMRAAMADAGHSMRDTVSAGTLRAFEAALQRHGFELHAYDAYRTWYCANSLMTSALRQAGVFPGMGIDRTLFGRALRDGKRMASFETPEFQIDLFAGLSDEEAEQLLIQALSEMDYTRAFVEEMIAAYVGGDLDALQALVTDGFNERPKLKKRFFSDRNAAWMRRIERFMNEPGIDLVVVGAGHLIGAGGLIESCREAGWSVVRL